MAIAARSLTITPVHPLLAAEVGGAARRHDFRLHRPCLRPVLRAGYPVTLTVSRAVDTMRAMTTYESRTRRWTRIEYEKLIALGIFQPGDPIELIGGELTVAEPQGAAHYTAVWKTAKALEAAFGAGWVVRTRAPIGLDDDSEPEPD